MDQHENEPLAVAGILDKVPLDGTLTPPPVLLQMAQTGLTTEHIPDDMLSSVAALDAGRLLNRLRFHLEQAWFGSGHHQRAARRSLGTLGRAVRNLVPAADRRVSQQAVIQPLEDLITQIKSEEHYQTFEDWVGEASDDQLTDEDFRRALEPAFNAIAIVRRSIEKRLEGPALLAFELGELLDQGICPPDVHQYLRRPHHALGQPEDELCWGSVRPGEEPPHSGWYDDVRQLLIELAIILDLPPDALALKQIIDDEATDGMVARIVEGVEAALTVSETCARRRKRGEPLEASPTLDSPMPTMLLVPKLSAELVEGDVPADPDDADRADTFDGQTLPSPQGQMTPIHLTFDPGSRTVTLDGKKFHIKDPNAFKAFNRIYTSTLDGAYITGMQIGSMRVDRLLRKWLPPELFSMLEPRDGKGGGYILSLSRKSP